MKRFRKSRSTAGFSCINVDKMFAISGGSLTTWGRSQISEHSTAGRMIMETIKVYNHSTGYYDLQETRRYFIFNADAQCRAGCERVRISLYNYSVL